MTRQTFKFAFNFPDMTDDEIDGAYQTVCAMFSGVASLWGVMEPRVQEAKRTLCYNLLTGWYLLDMYPARASGVIGNGGMALTSKSVGGTSLSFQSMDAQEGLHQLNTNVFGQKALALMQSAPERFGIYA